MQERDGEDRPGPDCAGPPARVRLRHVQAGRQAVLLSTFLHRVRPEYIPVEQTHGHATIV